MNNRIKFKKKENMDLNNVDSSEQKTNKKAEQEKEQS